MIGNIKKNPYGTENISITENGTTIYNVRSKKYASITTDVQSVHIYGAEWAGTSDSHLTRTDESANFSDPNPYYAGMASTPSSPFDGLMPWAGMRRVTNSAAGELVEIPKFWYKWTKSGTKIKIQVADGPVDGFYVSPAHADRGDGVGERDYVYVGRYHCSGSSSGTYKSVSGVSCKSAMKRSDFRTNIHSLGSNIWQFDYRLLSTIRILYLVEYANWSVQSAIALGSAPTLGTKMLTGITDTMPYHTGTMASSRSSGGACQYRYIENVWSNYFTLTDGITYNNSSAYIIDNPSNFSDYYTDGIYVGERLSNLNAVCIKSYNISSVYNFVLLQSEGTTDGANQYICDTFWYSADANYSAGHTLYSGGRDYNSNGYGMFYEGTDVKRTETPSANCSSRLMVLPSSQLT